MVILSLYVFLLELPVFSQVAINSDGTAADGSAMLDVKSTTRGVLVPRMTAALRDAITNPATTTKTTKINIFTFPPIRLRCFIFMIAFPKVKRVVYDGTRLPNDPVQPTAPAT